MNKIFPWQVELWQKWLAVKQQNRLPHALLLVGMPGLGKKQFALAFAQSLLCQQENSPCADCSACHLIQANSHPDLILLEPDQPGHMIKIDQIRETVQAVTESKLKGGYRVVIIHPANAMNHNAANALLKTLEEPAPNTLIILISDAHLRLPATITSRCQKILFQKPQRELAEHWLQSQKTDQSVDWRLALNLAEGAPLKALEYVESGFFTLRQELYQNLEFLLQQRADPLQIATKLQEQDLLTLINLLLLWLQDLLRFKITRGDIELINFDYQPIFSRISSQFSYANMMNYWEHLKKIQTLLLNSINLNRQLVLEELLIRWMQYATD